MIQIRSNVVNVLLVDVVVLAAHVYDQQNTKE